MRRIVVASLLPVLPVLSMLAAPARALPLASVTGVTLGVTGGTLGVGPEITYRLNPLIGVRASATFLGFSGHGNVRNFRYDGHVRLRSYGGTIDLHPFASGFRLSAGLRSTADNRVRFSGRGRGSQTYGGVTYPADAAGTIDGVIRTRDVAPLATIGYAHAGLGGFVFGIDGGVMFHGSPRVADIATTGQLATNPLAQAQVATAVRQLRDRVDDYRYYPVVQLSLGYRF